MSSMGFARNKITTVDQVTTAVDVTGDVDYVITNTQPFGVSKTGSVNIVDTEHAVVIIKSIKPSKVLSSLMNNIYIKGEKAVNGTNCIVQMYNRGAIIFPYDKNYKPLTCYTEENFQGESYNNYGFGNSGGFMNTLNTVQLNNNIKSFKLKRGHMVTFAVGKGGWGYSRCFIADLEDLEISVVPAPLKGKISSYRMFHWYNASKAGVHDTSQSANDALNTTSCFDWGQGNASLLPDVEWVSHHIYEDWPSAATCGSVTGTCHMKTNNEPGNASDDHPQDVATILDNWQNLMRTGLRLCSESSHDGSMGHLTEFINEIDKRGWRCDILDLHCYWDGQFNSLDWYISNYGKGRPCWISEWLWGSSWGNNGAFASGRQSDNATYDGTKPILDRLNSTDKVERYFYWNSEAWYTKIWRDNQLTKLGQYYATMDVGLGYKAENEYVPTIVYNEPSSITGTFTKSSGAVTLEWTDPNGDMLDSIVVERKAPGSSRWVKNGNVTPIDQASKSGSAYKYTTTEKEIGISYYRVIEYYDNGKKYISNEFSVTVAQANSVGLLQYGQLKIANLESVTTDIDKQDANPYVVMGMISNKNTSNGITSQIQSMSKSSFKFRFLPWTLTSPVDFKTAETIDYLILPPDTVMHLNDDMMLISQKVGSVKGVEVSVVFPEEFPEGVTPVVVAQQNTTVTSYAPVTVRVYDITNKGFKVKLVRQEGVTSTFNAQNVNYFACSPGQIAIGSGKLLTVGVDNVTPCGGSSRQTITFKDKEGNTLSLMNPYIIAGAQTNNYAASSIMRLHSTTKDDNGGVYCGSFRRQVDGTYTGGESNVAKVNGDYVGWMIISDDPEGTGNEEPIIVKPGTETGIISTAANNALSVSVSDGIIDCSDKDASVYNAAGQRVSLNKKVPAGIYVVTNGKKSVKVSVK